MRHTSPAPLNNWQRLKPVSRAAQAHDQNKRKQVPQARACGPARRGIAHAHAHAHASRELELGYVRVRLRVCMSVSVCRNSIPFCWVALVQQLTPAQNN